MSLITWAKSEPALVRALGTSAVGAAGAAGLTVTNQEQGALVSGVLAVLSLIQGWRTRAHTTPRDPKAELEAAARQAVEEVLGNSMMGDWRGQETGDDQPAA